MTWPAMLAAGIGLFVGGLAVFKGIYFAALRQLEADAKERSKEYRWRDLRYPKNAQ